MDFSMDHSWAGILCVVECTLALAVRDKPFHALSVQGNRLHNTSFPAENYI